MTQKIVDEFGAALSITHRIRLHPCARNRILVVTGCFTRAAFPTHVSGITVPCGPALSLFVHFHRIQLQAVRAHIRLHAFPGSRIDGITQAHVSLWCNWILTGSEPLTEHVLVAGDRNQDNPKAAVAKHFCAAYADFGLPS